MVKKSTEVVIKSQSPLSVTTDTALSIQVAFPWYFGIYPMESKQVTNLENTLEKAFEDAIIIW